MQGLFGCFNHKLDAKKRLTLPSVYRNDLSEDLVVTLSPREDCLYVFDRPGFTAWVKSLFANEDEYDSRNEEHTDMRLIFNSLGNLVKVDNAHRIGLPPELCEAAGLDKDVLIVGDDDRLTVWDAKRWDDFFNSRDRKSIMKKTK